MLPVLEQLFGAFLGDDQSKSTLLLPEVYSSGGSSNLWIDKLGQIRPIDGYVKQNVSAILTAAGSATRFIAMFPYRKTSGGVFTRQIIAAVTDDVDETELHFSTNEGVTWTRIVTVASVGWIPAFAQFGDELYFWKGAADSVPSIWDGVTLVGAGGTQLGAPTVVDSGPGHLNGNYYFALVPRKSDGTRKIASVRSALLDLQNRRASLSWTADTDVNVIGYEVYRTTGTGLILYFDGYSDGRLVVTYLSQKSDIQLIGGRVMQEHGQGPPPSFFGFTHKGRVWHIRNTVNPRTGWYSDPGDGDSVYQDENKIDFTGSDDMGDVATAGTGDFEGMAAVFLERAIFTVSGSGQVIGTNTDWTRRRTNAKMGAVSQASIIKVSKGAKYVNEDGEIVRTTRNTIAYFTPVGDIRLFDGDNDVIISHQLRDTLQTFAYAGRGKIWVLHDPSRYHLTWFTGGGANPGDAPDRAFTWNYLFGTWHHWNATSFGAGCTIESASTAQTLIVGDSRTATGGFAYKFFSGNSNDGANISPVLMTKPFWGAQNGSPPDMTTMKRFRQATLLFLKDASPTTGTYGWLPGDALDTDAVTGSQEVTQTTGRSRVKLQGADGKYFSHYGVRQKFTSVATTGPWVLVGVRLGYQVLPGKKRGT